VPSSLHDVTLRKLHIEYLRMQCTRFLLIPLQKIPLLIGNYAPLHPLTGYNGAIILAQYHKEWLSRRLYVVTIVQVIEQLLLVQMSNTQIFQ